MIDTKELRRKLSSDDFMDGVDIHTNVKPILTELINRLEAWENVFGHLGTPDEVGNEWHALSDRLEAAEKSAAESLMMYSKARDDCDELHTKIAEMERQEIGFREKCTPSSPAGYSNRFPLYTLPGTQGETK